MDDVKWPGSAYNPSGTDLSQPIRDLLLSLNLVEDPDEMKVSNQPVRRAFQTPPSMQVITAGGSALTKGWATFVGLFGGGGSLLALLQGLGYGSTNALQSAVFVAAAAAVAAAAVIAIAVIVRADVMSRATATAAEYNARAHVAGALMDAFQARNPLPIATKYWVKKTPPKGEAVDNIWYAVRDFNRDAHGLRVQIADTSGTWLREADIEDWRQSPD